MTKLEMWVLLSIREGIYQECMAARRAANRGFQEAVSAAQDLLEDGYIRVHDTEPELTDDGDHALSQIRAIQ